MDTATIRFHGDLNDLLAPALRHAPLAQPTYAGDQTIKHIIEALGVPHTEVGAIVVDGRPVTFDQLVTPGQQVAVYPVAPLPAGLALPPLRPPLARPPGFLLDNHLGRLARLLRLLGLDALYFNNDLDDAQLAQLAHDSGRVLLTRDRGLLKRALVTHGCLLRSTDAHEQVRAVLARYALAGYLRPWTRCLRCNGPLRPVPKAEILERLEPRTKQFYEAFHICAACDQVYWQGSHYEKLAAFVSAVSGERPADDPLS